MTMSGCMEEDHRDETNVERDPAGAPSPALSSVPADEAGSSLGTANTRRAYMADWRHFAGWCRRQGLEQLPPNPQVIGTYLAACADGSAARGRTPNAASTIERRLSAISWNYFQRGHSLDRTNPAITAALASIRRARAAPPRRKEVLRSEDIVAMIQTLEQGTLRGLRDRAILLVGFAACLRRSEIVGLDAGNDQSEDGRGWVELSDDSLRVVLRTRQGPREIEIGRGSSDAICPVAALQAWLKFARIARGPLFRRVTGQGRQVGAGRLTDRQVARLVQQTTVAAGIGPDLSTSERREKFAAQSLRAGRSPSAELREQGRQERPGDAASQAGDRDQRRSRSRPI